jgi:radical SAM superfamily enzyme YgiQ (UPF0313 family)
MPDGRAASLLAGGASTVLAVGDDVVSSWDLAGRPYALVRDTGTWRRGLDGRLLHKREATAAGPRLRERLRAGDGEPTVEAARGEAGAALGALEAASAPDEALARLRSIIAMDAPALAADAARFLAVCGPVPILPPDQYLALVVRVTEGCSWDACTFCSLYAGVPFRARTPAEVARHAAAVREYLGASIALRRSVFLGDANALCLSPERLVPLLDVVKEAFPSRPLYSFVDAWAGSRKGESPWRTYRERGLQRVYVGLETGDAALLSRLGKAGAPGDAVDLVTALRAAGVAAGVIVLLGAGGAAFAESHGRRTAEALAAMDLGPADVVYFSEYLPDAARRGAQQPPDALDAEGLARQRASIESGLRPRAAGGPQRATYDLREFAY